MSPFFFAASGMSPVWQDNCTVIVDNVFVLDGCPAAFLSNGPGSGVSGGGNPPPAAIFVLEVLIDSTGAPSSAPPRASTTVSRV